MKIAARAVRSAGYITFKLYRKWIIKLRNSIRNKIIMINLIVQHKRLLLRIKIKPIIPEKREYSQLIKKIESSHASSVTVLI